MTKKKDLIWSIHAALILILVGPLVAGTEGRVVGTVVDRAGKPIQGVHVVVSAPEIDFQMTRTSNKKGQFTLVLLEASRDYLIRLEKEGYQPIQESLRPKIGQVVRTTWTLDEGVAAGAGLGEGPGELDLGARINKIYESARKALREGDYETAIAKFQQVSEQVPGAPEPHVGLAMSYYISDQYDKALAAAERVVELDENNADAARVQFEVYRILGDSQGEARALARLEELDPSPETARHVFNLGVEHFKAGELEEAAGRFELAVEMDPELAPGYAALTRVYLQLGDEEKSVANGERAIELQSDDAGILHLLYGLYRGRGEAEKADAAFASMREASPQYVGDKFHEQGVTLFYDGDTAAAQEIFQRVVEALPEHPQAHYMMALCLVNAGEMASAKHHLNRFLELAPDDPEAPSAREMLQSL